MLEFTDKSVLKGVWIDQTANHVMLRSSVRSSGKIVYCLKKWPGAHPVRALQSYQSGALMPDGFQINFSANKTVMF